MGLPATQEQRTENLQRIGAELTRSGERFGELLPKNIPSPRFVGLVKAQLNNNPELRECTPRSIIIACEKAASDGLLLDGREAALVIYNKRQQIDGQWVVVERQAQYIPMVAGMRRRIYNSGLVSVLETGIVYKGEIDAGLFEYVAGTDPRLIHKPLLVGELGDRVAVYSVVTMNNGHKSVEVMRWSEVMRIAALQSKNVARYDDKKKGIRKGDLVGIWADHMDEMSRKTVLRRHSKQLPFDSATAAMFERVDGLYRSEGEEIDHSEADAPQDEQGSPPASAGKKAGAGKAALDKARQERASAEAAASSQTSEPERHEDVEDLEPVGDEDGTNEREDDRI
jgi:recombination protein RecT